jgi:hypothetical protein
MDARVAAPEEDKMLRQPWFLTAALFLAAALPANAQVIRGVIAMDNARSSC